MSAVGGVMIAAEQPTNVGLRGRVRRTLRGILGHEAPREESAEHSHADPPTALCAVTNCGQRWTTDTHGWRLCLDCLTELTA